MCPEQNPTAANTTVAPCLLSRSWTMGKCHLQKGLKATEVCLQGKTDQFTTVTAGQGTLLPSLNKWHSAWCWTCLSPLCPTPPPRETSQYHLFLHPPSLWKLISVRSKPSPLVTFVTTPCEWPAVPVLGDSLYAASADFSSDISPAVLRLACSHLRSIPALSISLFRASGHSLFLQSLSGGSLLLVSALSTSAILPPSSDLPNHLRCSHPSEHS